MPPLPAAVVASPSGQGDPELLASGVARRQARTRRPPPLSLLPSPERVAMGAAAAMPKRTRTPARHANPTCPLAAPGMLCSREAAATLDDVLITGPARCALSDFCALQLWFRLQLRVHCEAPFGPVHPSRLFQWHGCLPHACRVCVVLSCAPRRSLLLLPPHPAQSEDRNPRSLKLHIARLGRAGRRHCHCRRHPSLCP